MNEREMKIHLKQAFYNYIMLVVNDVRIFRKEVIIKAPEMDSPRVGVEQMFDFESYLE